MNTKFLFALLALSPLVARAQQAGDPTRFTGATDRINSPVQPKPLADNNADTTESEVSLDDLRDIGPLQVLNVTPSHKWFEAGAGVQVFYTDNVALLDQKTSGDVSVLTAHADVNTKPIGTDLGELAFHLDYDYAAFFYGDLSGRTNKTLAGSVRTLDRLDFQSHTGTLEAELRSGGWSTAAGVRAAIYYDTSSGDMEYGEISPYVRCGYTVELSPDDYLTVGADADYRFTHTPLPGGVSEILGTNLNDRFDIDAAIAYTRLLGEHWFVQPAYRVGFAQYTQGGSTPGSAGAGATTVTQGVILSAGYVPNSWLLARVFTSFEARDSSDSSLPSYRVTSLGLGVSVSAKF